MRRPAIRRIGLYLLAGALLTLFVAWFCALRPGRPLSCGRWNSTHPIDYPTETGLTERRWGWDIRRSSGDRGIIRIESWCFTMNWNAPPASPVASDLPGFPGFFRAVTDERERWLDARRDDTSQTVPNSRHFNWNFTFIDELAGWPWPALRSQMRAAVRESGDYDVEELRWGIEMPPPGAITGAAGAIAHPVHNRRLTALPLRPVWAGFLGDTLVFAGIAWGAVALARFARANVRLDRAFARSVVVAALLGAVVTYVTSWACAVAPRFAPPPPPLPAPPMATPFRLNYAWNPDAATGVFTQRRWPWSIGVEHPSWGLTRIECRCYSRSGRERGSGPETPDFPWFLGGAIDRRERWLETVTLDESLDAFDKGSSVYDIAFFDELAGWPLPAVRAEMRRTGPDGGAVEALRWGIPFPASTDPPGLAPGPGRPVAFRGLTALPLLPVLPGFLVNTALFGAVIWIPLCGFTNVRRTRRARHGRCERCGYDRSGLAAADTPCPECALAPQLSSSHAPHSPASG